MNSTAVIVALALGIPALAAAAARTAPIRRAAPNTAGIALQTVIIIVVMLLIAGGVSAVLVGRSSDVIGELEAASIGTVTADNCDSVRVGAVWGMPVGSPVTACRWASADIERSQCTAAGGKLYASGTPSTAPATHTTAVGGGHAGCIVNV